MIDKLNNINAGNAQNKRVSDNSKEKVSSSTKTTSETSDINNKASNVKISSELNLKGMSSEAPIDTVKVSAIKEAIAKGDYPINLDKVADKATNFQKNNTTRVLLLVVLITAGSVIVAQRGLDTSFELTDLDWICSSIISLILPSSSEIFSDCASSTSYFSSGTST